MSSGTTIGRLLSQRFGYYIPVRSRTCAVNSSYHDTAAKWVRMLCRFVIRAWIDYECSTSTAKFTPVTTTYFLLNKICDGGSSKEPFLKAATLSILIWAYPRETKTNNGNFKNAAILPSKVAYRWRACALILPLCQLPQDGKNNK